MSGGGGGGSSSQTVNTVQQIPAFEQQFAHENQDLARSLASQPYPVYQGELVAGFTPTQQAGQTMAVNAANAYQPNLDAAQAATTAALGSNPLAYGDPTINAGINTIGGGFNLGMPGVNAGMGTIGHGVAAGTPAINSGIGTVGNGFAAGSPTINAGIGTVGGGFAAGAPAINAGIGTIGSSFAGNPANPGVIQSYMSPFVQAALAPQVTALNEQLGQQQRQIDAQATQANAFGDARQGAASALANFYGNQSMAGLLGQGYNTAYSNALQTALQEQQLGQSGGQALANIGLGQIGAGTQAGNVLGNLGLGQIGAGTQAGNVIGNLGLGQIGAETQAGTAMGNLGLGQIGAGTQAGTALGNLGLGQSGLGIQEQGVGLQGAGQFANLADAAQRLGLQGANAVYDVGQQQQQLQQQALNTAYQQYLNQVQWPYQNLNTRISALSNSPYNLSSNVTLPAANQTASNLGMFAGLAGLLGGGLNGQSNGPQPPFGGYQYNPAIARAS